MYLFVVLKPTNERRRISSSGIFHLHQPVKTPSLLYLPSHWRIRRFWLNGSYFLPVSQICWRLSGGRWIIFKDWKPQRGSYMWSFYVQSSSSFRSRSDWQPPYVWQPSPATPLDGGFLQMFIRSVWFGPILSQEPLRSPVWCWWRESESFKSHGNKFHLY